MIINKHNCSFRIV